MFSAALVLSLILTAPPAAGDYFAISVVDDATGRGVPMIELRTVDERRYWTDSNGLVAFHEPGLMNQKVFFYVAGDGYEFPPDGFKFHGKALITTPGETAELRVKRTNVAQRLYRVTGAGIYRDSVLLGRDVPLVHPLLNAQVAGSDSVNSIVFRDQIYWFWGDTNRPAYPLGMFHVPGATSKLPSSGGLDPSRGVNLEYFQREDGFVASTAEMPGEGPTWIDGVCKVVDPERGERMFAKYVKVRKFLEVYQRGLVEFDPEKQRFEKVMELDFEAPLYPQGHTLEVESGGVKYLYFCNPYPLVRVPATAEALQDPQRYETYTCLAPGSTLKQPKIDRDASGAVRYGWKRDLPPLAPTEQARWLSSGKLKQEEALLALRDVDTGKRVSAHAGTVAFNPYRNRYVMITAESYGTSFLGETWYAEADSPLGPWVYARKVVSHAKYSFYNPRHHPMFDQDGGRRIFFEGTYTTFMTDIQTPTPLYNYNQIMYALELDDRRLNLPVAVRSIVRDGRQQLAAGTAEGTIVWMAADRAGEGLVSVGAQKASSSSLTTNPEGPAAFYALPADATDSAATTVAMYEWRHTKLPHPWYGVEGQPAPEGYVRAKQPLCRVWRYPLAIDPTGN